MQTTTQKQFVAAISGTFKTWFRDTSASFLAPLKSGGEKGASEREIGDAILQFIEDTRKVERDFVTFVEVPTGEVDEETGESIMATEKARDEDGNLITETVEIDLFGEYVAVETAKRMTHVGTRTNKQAERIAELEAMLAKLGGETA